jgi:hypothetical protein
LARALIFKGSKFIRTPHDIPEDRKLPGKKLSFMLAKTEISFLKKVRRTTK